MGSTRIAGPSIVAALVAACGGAKPSQPAMITLADSQNLDVGTVTGLVKNANVADPKCPVVAHFEASLVVTKLSGTVTYRWERSTGDTTKAMEVTIPEAGRTGTVTIPLKPDEWMDQDRDKQQQYTNRVHILAPIDRSSAPTVLSAMCH